MLNKDDCCQLHRKSICIFSLPRILLQPMHIMTLSHDNVLERLEVDGPMKHAVALVHADVLVKMIEDDEL